MNRKKKFDPRTRALAIILATAMALFSIRAFDLQVIRADRYAAQANKTYARTAIIKAARGEILDCYGRPIAVNREGYNIVFNRAYMASEDINHNILNLMNQLQAAGVEWIDTLPMTATAPYGFTENEAQVSAMKKKIGVNHYATAENCFDEMVKRYDAQGLDLALQRKLIGVRYSMDAADFSIANPYTFAEDIPADLMTALSEAEKPLALTGIEIQVVPVREYADGTVAPHIIGVVGKMSATEWEKYKELGYAYNDKVGKFGVEQTYESYLRGTDGEITYTLDSAGNILSSEVTKQPVPGNTLVLSIDKRLQTVAQEMLASVTNSSNADGGVITGASAVVVNVKTGQLLTAANYPSYDLNDFFTDASLNTDPGKPLSNRAFTGMYPPGSILKPAVALAALQNDVLHDDESINCKKQYTYYKDYQPNCMFRHGSLNVVSALSKSCNYFFFEVGRRLGITNMNKYCKLFGLGEYTGVEIEESKGILAGPEFTQSMGGTWYEGNTLQCAIGQLDNAFTPLQLAMYTATLANGGTRYQASLLQEIRSYSMDTTVLTTQPKVLNTVEFDDEVLGIVKEGMLSVAEEGTGRYYFADYPIKVGGKTGTAQTTGTDHALFTVFGPFEDPEIAISVVFEHGQNSTTTGTVVKALFDSYFFNAIDATEDVKPNTLLP